MQNIKQLKSRISSLDLLLKTNIKSENENLYKFIFKRITLFKNLLKQETRKKDLIILKSIILTLVTILVSALFYFNYIYL